MTTTPTFTRHIALEPADWYLAAWRNLPPLTKPAPGPFDLQACCARVATLRSGTWPWDKAGIPLSMSGDEARFWLEAMTSIAPAMTPNKLSKQLAKQSFDQPLGAEEIIAQLRKHPQQVPAEVILPLVNLFSPVEVSQLILGGELGITNRRTPPGMANEHVSRVLSVGFRRYLLPYLTHEERQQIQSFLRPLLDAKQVAANTWSLSIPYQLAGPLGMSAEVLDLVSRWADDSMKTRFAYHPDEDVWFVLFGLGSADLLIDQRKRLGLPLEKPGQVRGWLAHTEVKALDVVTTAIQGAGAREKAEELVEVLGLVQAPETAPHMLTLTLQSKAPALARRWLEEHLDCALPGLIPLAATRGAQGDAALAFLREVNRKGPKEQLETALSAAPEQAGSRVRKALAEVTGPTYTPFEDANSPEWLKKDLENIKPAKLPAWADPVVLPPLAVGEQCLNVAQVAKVLTALKDSTFEKPAPVLVDLKTNAQRGSLDAFAWALFERWLAEGGPSKDKWGMSVIGFLGGDACAMKLTPILKEWPGQSQHKRAVNGLECLRAINSETALLQLSSIADKVKFAGVKNRAQEFMLAIATERGLSPEQLQDRIVPTLDLDERGTRVFDYGPRQFRVALGPDLKPMIREEGGKLKAELPKPSKTDDATRATEASAAWKLLKKQLRDVLKIQATRLEKAMIDRRRWSVADFETLLVRHPLMGHLVRLVLWACFDGKGKVTNTFRVTEDRTFANIDDDPLTLDPKAIIGIVHPVLIPPDQRDKWGQVFGDYELLAPFPQLSRRVFTLEPGEVKAPILTRLKGKKVKGAAMLFGLKNLQWIGGGWTNGRITAYHRPYPEAGVTAVVTFGPGLEDYGYGYGSVQVEDQELDSIYFLPGVEQYRVDLDTKKAVELGSVDTLVMCEVLGLFTSMAEKGV